jgi:hypothetical protein
MREPAPYAAVLVRLLKGPVYSDSGPIWDLLFRHRAQIEDWFGHISLELVLAEHDGLAFLHRRREQEENSETGSAEGPIVPELVPRRELPYKLSLLCVLLLEELYRFEAGAAGESRLVLGRSRIRELMLPYLPKRSNEAKQLDEIDRQIAKLEGYEFIRRLSQASDEYEVTKLLKHKIDASLLAESLERLKSYHASGREENGDE